MEVILSYLENMFLHMPNTTEVLRAKEELASMMEDKYNELLAEGKKENEAIGIVISEFGDLSELAESLGLVNQTQSGVKTQESGSYGAGTNATSGNYEAAENYGTGANYSQSEAYEPKPRFVSRTEAEEYIETSGKSSKLTAIGVLLCIYCPIPVLFLGSMDSYANTMSDLSYVFLGVIPLLVMVAIAVAFFIYGGMKLEKFKYMKTERLQLETSVESYLSELEENIRPKYTRNLVVGIMLCIFSVIPLLIVGTMTDDDVMCGLSVIVLLIMVGIGVLFFIVGGSEMECIKVLKQEEEYTIHRKENNKIMDVIGGIYWPIVTAIYLGWSFLTANWGYTWIIWPIAGVLFGAIAAICGAVDTARKKSA